MTDEGTDGQTDRVIDTPNPIYPPHFSKWGYNNPLTTAFYGIWPHIEHYFSCLTLYLIPMPLNTLQTEQTQIRQLL